MQPADPQLLSVVNEGHRFERKSLRLVTGDSADWPDLALEELGKEGLVSWTGDRHWRRCSPTASIGQDLIDHLDPFGRQTRNRMNQRD